MPSSYYRGARFIFVVFDLTDAISFNDCCQRLKLVENCTDKDTIKVAIGLNMELADKRKVEKEKAQEFFSGAGVLYYEPYSCTDSVHELFTDVVKIWLDKRPHVNDNEVPDKKESGNGKECFIQ